MVFNSFEFAILFAVVFVAYIGLHRRAQNVLLLAGSYVFYGYWDWRFLGLLLASTLIDYVCALAIGASSSRRMKRWILFISVACGLGILGFFKYYNFFAEGLTRLLQPLGMQASASTINVVLPVGISFYTFQTLSYTIDVYREEIAPRRNFIDFALFVSFFPQLVAGPIERAGKLLPQIEQDRKITLQGLYDGSTLILLGLFQKIFVADNLARYVDPVFDGSASLDAIAVWTALYAFAFQIYCDFAGYSNIARGIAKWMGFELSVNFNVPYAATNPREFWRRWHITLSTWLRDYVFIPLGGNRCSTTRLCANLMITMTLAGLWHGARIGCVLWGAYWGVLLCSQRLLHPYAPKSAVHVPWAGPVLRFIKWAGFFHLTCFGLLIFRSMSIAQLCELTTVLTTGWTIAVATWITLAYLGFYLGGYLLLQLDQWRTGDVLVLRRWPWPVRSLAYAYMFYSIVVFGAVDGPTFFYFQF